VVELDDFDPILVVDRSDIFIGCVKIVDRTAMVTQGLEQLATVSATCLLHAFSHLLVMDPSSGVLGDVRRRYLMVFDPWTKTDSLPFPCTLCTIQGMFDSDRNEQWLKSGDHKPSSHEHTMIARALTELAWSEYQQIVYLEKKAPGWILHFAFHSLSMDPVPSTSVVVDCLSIIAIDLGCDASNTRTAAMDERCTWSQ